MTVTTDAPSAVAGISAAELEIMQDAANAFRQQFAGGGRHEPVEAGGVRIYRTLSSLSSLSSLPPPDSRAKCIVDINLNGSHYYR